MEPICKPMVNKSLDQMNGLQRAAESLWYVTLVIECHISPDGQIWRWIKTNVKLAMFIAPPTFMVFPVVMFALWELSSCVHSLTTIAGKLIVLPILVLVSIMIFFKIVSAFIKR